MRNYTFDAPAFEIVKSYRDDNGVMLVEGIASTVNVDQTGERMAPEAIAKMAARLIGKPLRSEHGKGWDDKLGEIVKADIVSDDFGKPALWIKARLYDWSSKAKDLFQLLKSGSNMGLSVAGKINPGGIVRQYIEKLGKYVMTYVDIDPHEVSVTDHPANLDAFDLSIAKSLNLDQVKEDDEIFRTDKPKEYEDVPTSKFLDEENKKYPADSNHLLPALRYFNHDGQRKAGGYDEKQWSSMGKKLSVLLHEEFNDEYQYDTESEKVNKLESSKGKGVNKNMDKTKLVSKKYTNEVADFIKQFNPSADIGGEVKKVDEVKKTGDEEVKKDHMSDTTTTSPSAKKAQKDDSKSGSDDQLSKLLSSLEDTLSNLSGGGKKEEGSSADESTKAKAKKADATDDSDDSDLKEKMTKAIESLQAVKDAVAKAKKTQTPSSDSSTSDTTMTKALSEVVDALREIKKSQDDIVDKMNSIPKERKSIARVVEKNLGGEGEKDEEDVKKSSQEYSKMLEKLQKDTKITMAEYHKYRNFGVIPEAYRTK